MDVLRAHIRRHLVGEIRATHEVAHVSAELNHQSRKLYGDGPVCWTALLQRLSVGLEMRAQQLLQIRVKWAVPGDGENLAGGRHEFVHNLSRGRAKFVQRVGTCTANAQAGLKMGLVALDAGGIASKGCECRQGEH